MKIRFLFYLILAVQIFCLPVARAERKKTGKVIYTLAEILGRRAESNCQEELQNDVIAYDLYTPVQDPGRLIFKLGKQVVTIATYGRGQDLRRTLRILRFYRQSRLTDKLQQAHWTALRILNLRLAQARMLEPFTDKEVTDYIELLSLSLQKIPINPAHESLQKIIYLLPAFSVVADESVAYRFLSITLSTLDMNQAILEFPNYYWKLVQQWFHLKYSRNFELPGDEKIQADINNAAEKYRDLRPYVR
jgi:hypothetical protein